LIHIWQQFKHCLVNIERWADDAPVFADAIHAAGAPAPRCIGFIDGTLRASCRPENNQREIYSGYKKVHVSNSCVPKWAHHRLLWSCTPVLAWAPWRWLHAARIPIPVSHAAPMRTSWSALLCVWRPSIPPDPLHPARLQRSYDCSAEGILNLHECLEGGDAFYVLDNLGDHG